MHRDASELISTSNDTDGVLESSKMSQQLVPLVPVAELTAKGTGLAIPQMIEWYGCRRAAAMLSHKSDSDESVSGITSARGGRHLCLCSTGLHRLVGMDPCIPE
jgi:hypothetical protein